MQILFPSVFLRMHKFMGGVLGKRGPYQHTYCNLSRSQGGVFVRFDVLSSKMQEFGLIETIC